MKMNRTKLRILVGIATLVLVGGAAVFASTNYGSESDPLITKSYLDEVVQPRTEAEVRDAVAAVADSIRATEPGAFEDVQLSAGASLRLGAGSEILLRSGSAAAGGALTDTTGGSSLAAGGALSANHMYLCGGEPCLVTAGSGGASVMVSGTYSQE